MFFQSALVTQHSVKEKNLVSSIPVITEQQESSLTSLCVHLPPVTLPQVASPLGSFYQLQFCLQN